MIRLAHRVWRARWNVLRWCVATFVLWAALADTPARLARLQLAALPDYDVAGEVALLRSQGRYGEALVIADAALESGAGADRSARADAIRRERELALKEQQSILRRAKDLGVGAVTGGAGIGPARMSLEMLIGAIATDMLVVGDVRDLIIQGYDLATTGRADPVIVSLSTIGIALTLAPEIDWAPSILKTARKVGTLGEKLGGFVVRSAKARDFKAIRPLFEDSAAIAKTTSPGTAVRLLRFAETPEDVARISRFLGRTGKRGALALHVTGDSGAAALKVADELRLAGRVDDAVRLEETILKAGAKGEAGAAWLRTGAFRALSRPHPLVGLLKGVYKGHAAALVQRALESMGENAWWVIGLMAGWWIVETGLLLARVGSRRGNARASTTPHLTDSATVRRAA